MSMADALNAILEEADSHYRVCDGQAYSDEIIENIVNALVIVITKRVKAELEKNN